jgi:hypothetical protein
LPNHTSKYLPIDQSHLKSPALYDGRCF